MYNINMPKVHKLKNGITLILDCDKNSLLTSVFVGVPVGSNNEGTNQRGMAHFLEHMCFKGTKGYPNDSTLQIKTESLGIYRNAFTNSNMTAYHLTGNAKHTKEMIHILSEMFTSSLFEANGLEKEKGVVIEEINRRDVRLKSSSELAAFLELFKGTQEEYRTLGTIDSIKSFNRDGCLEFYKKYYIADNAIISISGKFDEGAVLKKVGEEFENARRGEVTKHPILKMNKTLGNQFSSTVNKDMKQTNVAIEFYSVGEDSKKVEIAQLLGTVLGGGMSSRLVFKIREEMGACHKISAESHSVSTYGVFSIDTGINSNNFERVIKQIAVECGRLKTELITAEELENAKQVLIGTALLDTEAVNDRAGYYFVQYTLTGEIMTIAEYTDRINKVTATEIQNMAREIFKGDEVKIASVGDTKFEDSAVVPLLNV